MGYKLAGMRVLGGVEIDRQMMSVYRQNHSPKHSYEMSIVDFNELPDSELPAELFELDVLDGSPPCSVFSMAGSREKKWGEEHQFREGQARQVLDDLFGHFIATAKKLKPKVVVAENVKGMLAGNAKGYVAEVFRAFREAGYQVQLFLLNASRMSVPQRRERVFFIARRTDLDWEDLTLDFAEAPIAIAEALAGACPKDALPLTELTTGQWRQCLRGKSLKTVHPTGARFNIAKAHPAQVCPTLCAKLTVMHWAEPRWLSSRELGRITTFPDDFDYSGAPAYYVLGMSVPPFMMQRVALAIREQWLDAERT